MKSKISIWDCRRAIEIAGGLPLTIRGDLFAEPGPHPVGRWFPETAVHVTQLEVKQGRWVIGISVLRATGRNTSPSWRETSLRTTSAYMPRNKRTRATSKSPRKRQSASGPFPRTSHPLRIGPKPS